MSRTEGLGPHSPTKKPDSIPRDVLEASEQASDAGSKAINQFAKFVNQTISIVHHKISPKKESSLSLKEKIISRLGKENITTPYSQQIGYHRKAK